MNGPTLSAPRLSTSRPLASLRAALACSAMAFCPPTVAWGVGLAFAAPAFAQDASDETTAQQRAATDRLLALLTKAPSQSAPVTNQDPAAAPTGSEAGSTPVTQPRVAQPSPAAAPVDVAATPLSSLRLRARFAEDDAPPTPESETAQPAEPAELPILLSATGGPFVLEPTVLVKTEDVPSLVIATLVTNFPAQDSVQIVDSVEGAATPIETTTPAANSALAKVELADSAADSAMPIETTTPAANSAVAKVELADSASDAAKPIETTTPAANSVVAKAESSETTKPAVDAPTVPTPNAASETSVASPAGNWPVLELRLKTADLESGGFGVQDERPIILAKIADTPDNLMRVDPTVPVVSEAVSYTVEPIALPDAQQLKSNPTQTIIGRPTTTFVAQAEPPAVQEPPSRLFAPVGDEPETLSMAILSALEKNPEIHIAEAQRDDALYGVDESRAAMLPSLTLSASQGRERRGTNDPTEQDGLNTRSEVIISLRQNLLDFGVAHEAMRSAASVAESAEWSYRAQIDQVALRIAGSFHQLAERQAIVALAEQNLAAHEAILKTVQTQREFGLVTGADVSRIEARLNAAKSELMDRRSALEQAREDYRRLLDRAPGLVQSPPGVEDQIPSDVEDAVIQLEKSNPQVMQARRLMESLEQQRNSQRAGALPRFDLEMESARRDNVGGSEGRSEESRALISMRVPLFDGGARQAAVNRLSARIRQSQFQVERARRDAEQAVRNDYTALASAKGKIAAIDAEIAAAERLVGLYQEQVRTGSRSVFDVLDSQSTLYQAQVKRETNRTEVRLSGYRVLGTLGSLVAAVTKADNMNVRLFPAIDSKSVRGGRPTSVLSDR